MFRVIGNLLTSDAWQLKLLEQAPLFYVAAAPLLQETVRVQAEFFRRTGRVAEASALESKGRVIDSAMNEAYSAVIPLDGGISIDRQAFGPGGSCHSLVNCWPQSPI